jgi:hypothetical protein
VECTVTCTGTGSYKVRNRRRIPLFAVVALDNLRIGRPIAGSHLVCCPSREKYVYMYSIQIFKSDFLDTYKPLKWVETCLYYKRKVADTVIPDRFPIHLSFQIRRVFRNLNWHLILRKKL